MWRVIVPPELIATSRLYRSYRHRPRPRLPVEGPDTAVPCRGPLAANHHGAASGLTAIARIFRLLELTQQCRPPELLQGLAANRERATIRRTARDDIRMEAVGLIPLVD